MKSYGLPCKFHRVTDHSLQAFWDSTGGIWQTGGYWGKYVSPKNLPIPLK